MKKQLLVIDGYNVIGNWPHLNQMKLDNRLADARDELLREISEYKKYRELNIIVIFDAMYVPGLSRKDKHYNLDIIWTNKNETADSYIESFVRKKQSRFLQVVVVTSDQAEQWTVFSAGALRLPARELLRDIQRAKTEIQHDVKSYKNQGKVIRNTIPPDQMMVLEKLRDDLSK
ncbi:NYN domain-containing protein [Apilactobacillus ozensis]|uniref:NYN domain-containing protein n=1 Tax=Apilactobacillus ozensis TaxID=866801 RepID=UPI00200B392C|nr:NYN domain-containing protein [Apilactobacillus ozensis]MCK8607621.1 NYN domain-containing protein [Apilactobacillus ozensis]